MQERMSREEISLSFALLFVLVLVSHVLDVLFLVVLFLGALGFVSHDLVVRVPVSPWLVVHDLVVLCLVSHDLAVHDLVSPWFVVRDLDALVLVVPCLVFLWLVALCLVSLD